MAAPRQHLPCRSRQRRRFPSDSLCDLYATSARSIDISSLDRTIHFSASAQQPPSPHAVSALTAQHSVDWSAFEEVRATGRESGWAQLRHERRPRLERCCWGVLGEVGKPRRVFCLSARGEWLAFAKGIR